jgi:hypothetical protein
LVGKGLFFFGTKEGCVLCIPAYFGTFVKTKINKDAVKKLIIKIFRNTAVQKM